MRSSLLQLLDGADPSVVSNGLVDLDARLSKSPRVLARPLVLLERVQLAHRNQVCLFPFGSAK
jgi:hypothetical protein